MNAKKYRVRWMSLATGQQGHGQPISMENAEAWVKKLNREEPTIRHWIEPVQETSDEC